MSQWVVIYKSTNFDYQYQKYLEIKKPKKKEKHRKEMFEDGKKGMH